MSRPVAERIDRQPLKKEGCNGTPRSAQPVDILGHIMNFYVKIIDILGEAIRKLDERNLERYSWFAQCELS